MLEVVASSEAGERCRRAMPLALRGKLADLRDDDEAVDALRYRIADEVKRKLPPHADISKLA